VTASQAVQKWRKECKRLGGRDYYSSGGRYECDIRAWSMELLFKECGQIVSHCRQATPAELRQPGYAEALAAEMVAEAKGRRKIGRAV